MKHYQTLKIKEVADDKTIDRIVESDVSYDILYDVSTLTINLGKSYIEIPLDDIIAKVKDLKGE